MRVFVTVGTDHHPFNRLVKWANNLKNHEIYCQYGTSVEPTCAGDDFISYEELIKKIEWADAVITHGGPSTIMDVLSNNKNPIVVPRNPNFGEHIDDHQMRFGNFLAKKGLISISTINDLEHNLGLKKNIAGLSSDPIGVHQFGILADKLILSE